MGSFLFLSLEVPNYGFNKLGKTHFLLSLKILKPFLFHISLFLFCHATAQDNIYFLDGTTRSGKVLEISDERIIVKVTDEKQNIPRSAVLLIEYKNGSIEIYNTPNENITYNPVIERNKLKTAPREQFHHSNFGSINTLALCNADISGFFEHMLPNGYIGLGAMGAYNFNPQANLLNLFIATLNNSKKKYDLGVYANFYPGEFQPEETSFYFGILFKYMRFDYTKVTEIKAPVGSSISSTLKYSDASGSQMATLFTFGTHTHLEKNFFIKTTFGIGGFNLRGDYRDQYNYFLNGGTGQTNPQNLYNRKFLLKLYLGINAGFTF